MKTPSPCSPSPAAPGATLGGVGGGAIWWGGCTAIRRSAIGWCTQAGWCSRRQSTFPELDARSTGVHVPPCRAHHCPTTDGLGAIVTPAGWVGGRREGERGEWGGMPCRRVSAFYLSGWGGREERGQWRGCRGVAAPRPTIKTDGGSYPEAVSGRGRARGLNRPRTHGAMGQAQRPYYASPKGALDEIDQP